MIIYFLSSPDDPIMLLTPALAAVVAAQKGAEREGVVLEIGTWDTDNSPICSITLNMEIPSTPVCSCGVPCAERSAERSPWDAFNDGDMLAPTEILNEA